MLSQTDAAIRQRDYRREQKRKRGEGRDGRECEVSSNKQATVAARQQAYRDRRWLEFNPFAE